MKASHALISIGIASTSVNTLAWLISYGIGCFIYLTFTPFEITENIRGSFVGTQCLFIIITSAIIIENQINLVKIYRDRYKK